MAEAPKASRARQLPSAICTCRETLTQRPWTCIRAVMLTAPPAPKAILPRTAIRRPERTVLSCALPIRSRAPAGGAFTKLALSVISEPTVT